MEIPLGLCQCGCGARTNLLKGMPRKYILRHHLNVPNRPRKKRQPHITAYRGAVSADGIWKDVHRIKAEKALGKPLPHGAIVHHADGTRSEQSQLVICQNQAYHMLLHARMRVKAAGGDPRIEARCGRCRQVLAFEHFYSYTNGRLSPYCRECTRRAQTEYFRRQQIRRTVPPQPALQN